MRPSRSSSIVPLRSPQLVENEGAGIPDVWEICGVPGGCSRARSSLGAHKVCSRARSSPGAHRVPSTARPSPEAHRVHSRARSSPGALKICSRARSSQVMALCSTLVASSSVGTALAPLSTSVSRPCASTSAWPTILPPDLPPTHPLPRHFVGVWSVWILLLKGGFVSRSCWCALAGHQMSVCLFEHMACSLLLVPCALLYIV